MRSLTHSAGQASWRLFQALLLVASILAAAFTFATISGADPGHPFEGRFPWLFGVNSLLILILGWLLARRYFAMRAGGALEGGGRLTRRFLLLFSLSAVVPAFTVALFLGGTLTRGLDNWFDARIGTLIEETAEVARGNINAFSTTLEDDARLMAEDLASGAETLEANPDLLTDYLKAQAAFRQFRAAFIVDSTGQPVAGADLPDQPDYSPPPAAAIDEARQGMVGQTLYERSGLATALAPLTAPEGAYLYVFKDFDVNTLAQMRRAERALNEYRAAQTRSTGLQILFAVGYAQIAILALLLFGRVGLEAAGSVVRPIGRLAGAANAVRDGDLGVRLPPTGGSDELDILTRSFNTMTEQLSEQREALVSSREVAEDGRRFLETLLSKVSAGVIRTDKDFTITLANHAADGFLGATNLHGRCLDEVAPAFAAHARTTLSGGEPVDASFELRLDSDARHVRLKAAPDAGGGCVLTFDDMTRLVTAQRQFAWRDVARRIAHEIRNPLTPIQLSAERLRRRFGDKVEDDDGVFERCLETIMRQVSDIGRMVEEFSNFARMPKPSNASFDLTTLIQNTAFAQGMISPEITIDADTGRGAVSYFGDERLLGQAFANVLKNAAESIDARTDNRKRGGRIDIRMREESGRLVVEISDNGAGFPDRARSEFLEPYVTTRERGSGLGLAIVNRIVMDHGGSVSLHDRADGLAGAVVRIVLPSRDDRSDFGDGETQERVMNAREPA